MGILDIFRKKDSTAVSFRKSRQLNKKDLKMLSKKEQDTVERFIGSTVPNELISVRVSTDNNNKLYLYGCFRMSVKEFEEYKKEGGEWDYIRPEDVK